MVPTRDGGWLDELDVAELDLSDPVVAKRLADLLRASYAVEAELIGFDGIPGLGATAESVVADGRRWRRRGLRAVHPGAG